MIRLAIIALLAPATSVAATAVCVDVEVKSWAPEDEKPAEAGEQPKPAAEAEPEAEGTGPILPLAPTPVTVEVEDPFAIDPARYLGRMVRYEVTHEPGFEAVDDGCAERMTVELYPLRAGWTVFARYTGSSREEKVDQVQLDEFVPLARRVTRALLRDTPITDTITRETVLRADSEADLRTIDGSGHFVLAVGGQLRVGSLPTVVDGALADETRPLYINSIQLGYRGKYRAWGVDFFARGALGNNSEAPRRNPEGGHIDFDGSAALGLHFLRYFDAEGVTSFYMGGGAQFELSVFSVIRPEDDRASDDRERFVAGGINADLLLGWEFMRASSVHFYLQAEAHLPTYLLDVEVDSGGVETYLPGAMLQVGMVF